jgi:hypothetical protein
VTLQAGARVSITIGDTLFLLPGKYKFVLDRKRPVPPPVLPDAVSSSKAHSSSTSLVNPGVSTTTALMAPPARRTSSPPRRRVALSASEAEVLHCADALLLASSALTSAEVCIHDACSFVV